MESRTQVAQYAGTMAKELRKMCHQADLNDLAYLFEVAASEAAQVKQANGSVHPAAAASLTATHA
jgi:hypothetical protein